MPKITRREVLVGVARATGHRWRSYFVLAAVAVAGILTALFVPFVQFREGYAGLALAVLAPLVVISLIGQNNPAADDAVADAWSLAPLRKTRGWWVVDNLPFDRDDVDHVVVAPAAILAVESHYHPTTASAERLARELHSADRAAHKVRLLLRAERMRNVATVVPVLIVWGPGAPELPEGHEVRGGVHLVDGSHPQRWMHLFAAPRLSLTLRRELHARFEQFANRTAGIDARVMVSLRTEMWRELKTAISEERAHRAARHLHVPKIRTTVHGSQVAGGANLRHGCSGDEPGAARTVLTA
jgi:hypothetical protein